MPSTAAFKLAAVAPRATCLGRGMVLRKSLGSTLVRDSTESSVLSGPGPPDGVSTQFPNRPSSSSGKEIMIQMILFRVNLKLET